MKNKYLFITFFLFTVGFQAQTVDSLPVDSTETLIIDKKIIKEPYDPLAPSRAAFYSAVVPGLGQAYNKKYWKIPIVYAGIATGIYFHIKNDQDYDRFRDAYKRRLAGFTDDEFYGDGATPIISNERLINAQENAQKNKDVSIIVAVAFYLVNIIDANVDAHLKQFNVSDDLSIAPNLEIDPIRIQANYGFQLKYNLK